MTFDTFYLLFKSDTKEASQGADELEKRIESLTAKGKKRTDQEDKALKEAIKKHKEINQSLKDQERQTDKLVTSIANVAAAYISFSAIKAGIINTSEFNRALSIQSKNLGQNADDLLAYSAAVKSAGGSQEAFLSRMASKKMEFAGVGLPFEMKSYYKGIREFISGMTETGRLMTLTKLGITDPGEIALLQMSNTEFEKRIKNMYEVAAATKESRQASEEFGTALDNLESSAMTFFSSINSSILPALTKLFNKLSNIFVLTAKNKDFLLYSLPPVLHPVIDNILLMKRLNEMKNNKSTPDRSTPMVNQDSMKFWMSQGYTREAAAGITANEHRESAGNPNARGDGGQAHGLFQWHSPRRADILQGTGIDVSTASREDQLRAAAWEMKKLGLDETLKGMTDPAQAAAFFSNKFERPANGGIEALNRAQMAIGLINSSPIGASGSSSAGRTTSIKIDEINVNTQATDAHGIAGDIGEAMNQQFRTTVSNFDDGVAY